jgi:1-acyl-sn-glycerol-3-phosphate acyltransferase
MSSTRSTIKFPKFIYKVYRFLLRIYVPIYLDLRYAFEEAIAPGPKVIAGNHPTVWDAMAPLVAFRKDVIHTLIEEQIWSLPFMGFLMKITNQVKVYRGVQSVRSIREATEWLRSGDALLMAPEGERTPVGETRAATQGAIRLAIGGRAPIVPFGIWLSEKDTRAKPVDYDYKGDRYTVESYFPRFRAKYAMVFGKPIQLNEYYGKRVSHQDRQKLADMLQKRIYVLKKEARRLCQG